MATKECNIDFDEFFYSIIDMPCVKKSFDDLIYRKLIIDSYIYCKDGLIPSNKSAFKPLDLADFPLWKKCKNKNPISYEELYNYFMLCSLHEKHELSKLQEELVLYLIFQIEGIGASAKVMLMLYHYYTPEAKYKQFEEFVCSTDVELRQISSLQDYIKYISEFVNVKNLFFRGHSNINYVAVPSLFREKRYYKNEYMMYQELVIRCTSSFVNCTSHLDFLIEMQHYGLPTRLLDITSNPLVALYFACENEKNVGEIIVYNVINNNIRYEKCDEVSILTSLPMFEFPVQQSILRDVTSGNLLRSPAYDALISEVKLERPLLSKEISYAELTTPVLVKPARKNSRILRQEGAFIIWGLDNIHYSDSKQELATDDKFRYRENSKKFVYYIPSAYKKSIMHSLNRVGINKAFVYPEIDDVAEYIKESI